MREAVTVQINEAKSGRKRLEFKLLTQALYIINYMTIFTLAQVSYVIKVASFHTVS